MRASRLLSLLMLLQTRGRMTATELAAELEVSVRTVYRDVESLAAAGVPVYADRGPTGGYQLLDGYRTRLTGLTGDEAESLFFTGMPGPAAELGLGGVLAATELKLLAALPVELRSRAERIRERFHLDAPSWFRGNRPMPHLGAIADAVWNERRARMRYERWKAPREVTRIVDPLGLALKAGVWYLVARADGDLRTYRAGKILDWEPLPEQFERPADFDLAEYWQSWVLWFESSVYVSEAVVRFNQEALRRMPVFLGPGVERVFAKNAQPPDPDGWVQAVIPIENLRVAHTDLLKFGADIEVLEPVELREMLAATVRAMSAIYR